MSSGPPKSNANDEPIEIVDDDGLIEIVDMDAAGAVSLDEAPDDLPQPMDLVDIPPMAAPPSASGQLELADLPAPGDLDLPMPGDLDLPAPADLDLPAPSDLDLPPLDLGVQRAAPAMPSLDDLPASVEPLSLDAGPELSAPAQLDDLPAPPSLDAPNLMDDSAISASDVMESVPPPDLGPSRDANGLIELQDSADSVGHNDDTNPGIEIAGAGPQARHAKLGGTQSVGGEPAPPPNETEVKKKQKRKAGVVIGGTAAAFIVVAIAVYFSPLGETLELPGRKPPPVAPPPVAKATAKTAADAPKPAAALPAPEPMAAPPPLVPLTRASVNGLNYASLVAGMAKLGGDKPDVALKWWAAYRLAEFYDDPSAQTILNEALGVRWEPPYGPLGLAAQAGAAMRLNKMPLAKKGLARAKGPAAKAPEVMFMNAVMLTKKKPVLPRVWAMLEKVSEAGLDDATLMRAELGLAKSGKERDAAVQSLVRLGAHGNPDAVARAAVMLWRAEAWDGLKSLVSMMGNPSVWVQASPKHRDVLWQLWLCKRVRDGELKLALSAANERFKNNPSNVESLIQLLRMMRYTGGDVDGLRTIGFKTLLTPEAQAHVWYDGVVMALRKKDDQGAQAAYRALMSLPESDSLGWTRLAEGDMALAAGNRDQAKVAYTAAAAWRGETFDEGRVALQVLEPQGDRILGLKEALNARHNASGPLLSALVTAQMDKAAWPAALQAQEALLWMDPTYQDPMDTLLRAVDLTDRSGEAMRAATWAETIATAHPEDNRPVQMLVELAQRGKRYGDMVKWYMVLLQRHPHDRATTVALANAYIDAGDQTSALRVLEDLAKVDPEARDADFLYTEGRAFGAQDMVKARGFFTASLKVKPMVKTYVLMGDLEAGRGKSDEALEAYRNAIQLDPNMTPVQLKMAHILIGKGFTKEAIASLQNIVARDAHNTEASEMLGDALREQGDAKGAVDAYQHAIGVHPEMQAALLLKLSRVQLQEVGDVPGAAKTLREVVHADPRNAEAQYYFGFALRDMGKLGEAKGALQTYLRLAPEGEFANEVRQTLSDMGGRR